jgi:hypothetical protein
MIDIRHRIRADGGRIRVLRLAVAGRHIYPLRYHARPGPGCVSGAAARISYACPGGCSWVNTSAIRCAAAAMKGSWHER